MTTENTLDSRTAPTPAPGLPKDPFLAVPPAPEGLTPVSAPAPAAPETAPSRDHGNNSATPAPTGLIARLHGLFDVLLREVAKFGVIGALGYVVTMYVYNLLRVGIWPIHDAPLASKTVLCSVIANAIASVVTWVGNRYWTFRHRRRTAARAEFLLFMVMNVGGMAIAAGCLGFSHYVLGLTSPLADNIASNVVGLVLGTLFRFWAYRKFVFTDLREELTTA